MTASLRFETLIERYHDEIYRYLWRFLHSSDRTDSAIEAQDLTQEVFLRAYRAFTGLKHESNHRAWLYKIATNHAYTVLKRGRRLSGQRISMHEEAGHLPAAPGDSPEHQLGLSEKLEAVRQAIAALPPKQRAAVVLRHVQGLDYSAIADSLDCSEDSARANVYQALRRLRQTLAEELV